MIEYCNLYSKQVKNPTFNRCRYKFQHYVLETINAIGPKLDILNPQYNTNKDGIQLALIIN